MIEFNEIWESLDRDKVVEAIGKLKRQFDTDAATECVYYAAHRWLPRDLEAFVVEGLEDLKIKDNFKYVVDVKGYFTGKGGAKIQQGRNSSQRDFKNLEGKKFILDWKTSKNTLDQEWVSRYLGSFQWRHYLNKEQADIFIYRGIRRRNAVNGDLELKEFMIHRSEDPKLEENSNRQIELLKAQRDQLIQIGQFPWPQNRPEACSKFGYTCKYDSDCWSGDIPGGTLDINHPVSYSRMSDFLLCPERYRRNALEAQSGSLDEGDESESASFGNSVHRGLAEVYSQAFGIQQDRK